MQGTARFRTLFAYLANRWATARRGAFEWTPEAERMPSALEMHEFGVQLYDSGCTASTQKPAPPRSMAWYAAG